jgi:hypothetical protein
MRIVVTEIIPVGTPDPIMTSIGDIAFSTHWLVTPVGTKPLRGTQILVTDFSRTERKTPGWAIVVAILLAIFTALIGLLFLLVKETVTVGSVQVTVHNDGLSHATQVFVRSPYEVGEIQQRANYARQLIAVAQ